jgi:hypothetical protein
MNLAGALHAPESFHLAYKARSRRAVENARKAGAPQAELIATPFAMRIKAFARAFVVGVRRPHNRLWNR